MLWNRRRFLSLAAASALATPRLAFSRLPDAGTAAFPDHESQRGDPDASDETLHYSATAIRDIVSPSDRAVFEKRDPNLALSMLTQARMMLGSSRATSPAKIVSILDLFGLPFKIEGSYVPFCAAGISYSAALAFVADMGLRIPASGAVPFLQKYLPDIDHYFFYPTASCADMKSIAEGRHRWIRYRTSSPTLSKRGWIVLYDWTGSGHPDHCGIVMNATAEAINTVEFNTSGPAGGSQRDGGTVAEKSRGYQHVAGYISS